MLSMPGPMMQARDWHRLIDEAWAAFHRRDWDAADALWAEVREQAPEALIGYAAAVTNLRVAHRLEAADALAREMLERFPDEPAAHTEYAWSIQARGDLPQALALWGAIRARFPDQWIAHLGMAKAHESAGDTDAEEAALRRGAEAFPEQQILAVAFAAAAGRRKDWSEAARRWAAVGASFPENRQARMDGARACRELGQFDTAEVLLRQALDTDPDDPAPAIELAATALYRRDWASAERQFAHLRTRFPDRVGSYGGGIIALRELRRFEEAETVASEAVRRFPNEFGFRVDRAWVAQASGDWATAAERWASLRRDSPGFQSAYREGARALSAAGRHAEAESLLIEARRRFPEPAAAPPTPAAQPVASPPFASQAPVAMGTTHIVLPKRSRQRIVLLGNCQAQAMSQLYDRFVGVRTGDIVQHVASYEDVAPAGRAALEQADLIVEQLFDLRPKAETGGIVTSARRIYFPMITGAFLWPFAGQAHPNNIGLPWLPSGPYGGESADSFLNRLILAGKPPEEAVETYMNSNVTSRVNLDRLYELVVDRQRSRDATAGYDIAGPIEQYFRTEQVFLSQYHPNRRIALVLATRMFQQIGAQQEDIDRMHAVIRSTPFPKTETPIHPAVARHFGLEYAPPERRYRYMNEGNFTAREYALRYMRYEWNEALEEGMHLAHTGQWEPAQEKLLEGLMRSPNSSAGHGSLANVLAHRGDLNAAVVAARRAIDIEPDTASYRSTEALALRGLDRLEEADTAFRAALAAEPTDTHLHVLYAHLCRQRGKFVEAIDLIRHALTLAPYSLQLFEELAYCQEAAGEFAEALKSVRQGLAIAPDNAALYARISGILRRLGDTTAAVTALRQAVALAPNNQHLNDQLALLVEQTRRQCEPVAVASP